MQFIKSVVGCVGAVALGCGYEYPTASANLSAVERKVIKHILRTGDRSSFRNGKLVARANKFKIEDDSGTVVFAYTVTYIRHGQFGYTPAKYNDASGSFNNMRPHIAFQTIRQDKEGFTLDNLVANFSNKRTVRINTGTSSDQKFAYPAIPNDRVATSEEEKRYEKLLGEYVKAFNIK